MGKAETLLKKQKALKIRYEKEKRRLHVRLLAAQKKEKVLKAKAKKNGGRVVVKKNNRNGGRVVVKKKNRKKNRKSKTIIGKQKLTLQLKGKKSNYRSTHKKVIPKGTKPLDMIKAKLAKVKAKPPDETEVQELARIAKIKKTVAKLKRVKAEAEELAQRRRLLREQWEAEEVKHTKGKAQLKRKRVEDTKGKAQPKRRKIITVVKRR